MRGTMTGALLCSMGMVSEGFAEEKEEGEEEGTLGGSLSPVFMVGTMGLTLVSRLLGFGEEFSERHLELKQFSPFPIGHRTCNSALHWCLLEMRQEI